MDSNETDETDETNGTNQTDDQIINNEEPIIFTYTSNFISINGITDG